MGKKQTGHISCVNKGGGVKRVSIWLKWWQIHSDICTTFIHPVVAATQKTVSRWRYSSFAKEVNYVLSTASRIQYLKFIFIFKDYSHVTHHQHHQRLGSVDILSAVPQI